MNFFQSFRLAIKSLVGSKVRALLTMLGIIIGVGAVIVIISIFNGMSASITEQFEEMGTNLVMINVMGRGSNRQVEPEEMQEFFEENDLFVAVSPTVSATPTLKTSMDSISSTSVMGVNEYYTDISNLTLESGRFIQYADVEFRSKICVVGTYVAQTLFGTSYVVGETIKMNGEQFTIVGVLEEGADSEESSSDDIVYIPYTVSKVLTGMNTVSSYSAALVDKNDFAAGTLAIETFLYGIFADEDAYRVTSMSEMVDSINEMTGMMSMVMAGIAGISLLVGGIGIMNIMLVSVTERTREIGIRKSIGAREGDIMSQFVIEAATTSAVGGIIGIVFGVALSFGMAHFLDITAKPSLAAIVVAFGVSVAIGIIFGYLPASKAAKLNPIDALRYD